MAKIPEEVILDAINHNPHKAFSYIVENYSTDLYWTIRRLVFDHEDANDVLQNSFLKAWKGLGNFRNDSSVKTWLYRICINESLSFLSDKRKKLLSSMTDLEEIHVGLVESEVWFSGDDAEKKLHKAIASLPEKQRLVFNLKYFENMGYDEMSKLLNTSEGALKASYHIATTKIKAIISITD